MPTNHVYEKYFWKETSNGMGSFHQLVLDRMFTDLDKPFDIHHDHSCGVARVEGKMARAFEKPRQTKKALERRCDESLEVLLDDRVSDTLRSRALVSIDGDHIHGKTRDGRIVPISNTALQQITVSKAELLLATMVFLDKMRFYLVPTRIITPRVGVVEKGRLSLGPQHGNDFEGILFLQKIVPCFVHETSLPIANLDKTGLSIAEFLKKSLKNLSFLKAS